MKKPVSNSFNTARFYVCGLGTLSGGFVTTMFAFSESADHNPWKVAATALTAALSAVCALGVYKSLRHPNGLKL